MQAPILRNSCAAALAALAVLFALPLAKAAETVNLLTWEGYADDSFAKPYEQQSGCKVSATYVGSNDEMLAKLAGGKASVDLVSPSNDTTMRAIDAGMVEPIDTAKLPNLNQFFPEFQSPEWLTKDGKLYGVPYGWGIIRIIFDADALDGAPDSLAVLWNPKYKGKIAVWDDIELIYMAARLLGFKDSFNLTDEQLNAVRGKLKELKPNIRRFWTTASEMDDLMSKNEVIGGMAWEATLVGLRKQGRKVLDLKPEEGRGGWSDSWLIVKGASGNPCVYSWLNWVSSAESQALAHAVTGYGYSNARLVDYLDADTKKVYHELGMDDPENLKKVDWWKPVKQRDKYLALLREINAAEQ